jgi:hypothetical protein
MTKIQHNPPRDPRPKWDEMRVVLIADGYIYDHHNAIDAAIASNDVSTCCHAPVQYHGVAHGNGAYRAFLVCTGCGEAEEF